MSVIELRDKDQRIAWDVPNLMVCELTYLGQPLTYLGQPLTFQVQVRSNKKFRFPGRQFRQVFRQ